MYHRISNLPEFQSFFLFGPRGSGKTWLLRENLKKHSRVLWIDLLKQEEFLRYTREPSELEEKIAANDSYPDWIVIDEVQRIPSLLNEVHRLLEDELYHQKIKFALSGSSARKLKRGGANLLAGRAVVNYLHPLTFIELGTDFSLEDTLSWGSLPRVANIKNQEEKSDVLKSYVHTYIREEIREEQVVRKIDPFVRFLEIAASANSEMVNFSKIARQIYSNTNTVQRYFQILEDTLLGFFLEAYHPSVRKRQAKTPKFYLFDTGVARAMSNSLSIPLLPSSYSFGKAFEHFVILEAKRLNDYFKRDFRFYYYHVDGNEIDLVVERPGRPLVLIEIKSSRHVDEAEVAKLSQISKAFREAEKRIFSLESTSRRKQDITIMPWNEGIKELLDLP
ncbi:MAG: ATP-binding protein [Deltaproteobacteria bacterium]|nr:ATP-binding protein [Deltaproteobacteria bacterium]